MPVIRINALQDQPIACHQRSTADALADHVHELPGGAPVIVMIHGYKHAPSSPRHDPHEHILSPNRTRGGRGLSWPRHLGFGRCGQHEGLGIAFGWEARGTIWQAYREARRAGQALARLIQMIRAAHGGPVDIVAHSLGARVALCALPHVARGAVGRMILMSGAEFGPAAQAAMASPAGRCAEVLNVTSGENRVFDLMFEALIQWPFGWQRAVGAGLPTPLPRWVNLRIDCDGTRAHLKSLGFPTAPPSRLCHWSGYRRAGLFRLYNAFLRDRAAFPIAMFERPIVQDAPVRHGPKRAIA